MRLDITRQEAEYILDLIECGATQAQRKRHDSSLKSQLMSCLGKHNGSPKGWAPIRWAPIRSAWPQNIGGSSKGSNWSYRKPRDKKPKVEKPELTADDILAMI